MVSDDISINYKIYALKVKGSNTFRYIGLTKLSLEKRLKNHLRDKIDNYKNRWIKSVGKENIEIVLIEENIKTKEETCTKEIYYISKFKNDGYQLVNTTNSGEGWFNGKFTEEHKLNISLNHADVKGEKNPMFGKKHTKQAKKIIKQKNKKHYSIGFTNEHIEKLKKAGRGIGNPNAKLTEEEVIKIRKEYNNGNILQKELAIKYNVQESAIFKIINRLSWKHI